MELRHLRYFLAVAEELNFRKAAERLHMATPPLSQQIRSLENELGVQLFDRTKRWVRLTEAGRVFLERARSILSDAEVAVEAARRASRGHVGRLSIGFIPAADLTVIPRVLPIFRRRFPEVQLMLHTLSGSRQIQALLDRRIDIGFLRSPVEEEALSVEPVLREALLVALPEEHPLASRTWVPCTALHGEQVILFPRETAPGFYDLLQTFFQTAKVELRVIQETEHLQTTLGLVASGLGLAFVPSSVRPLRRPGVAYRPLRPSLGHIDLLAARRRDNPTRAIGLFLETLKEALKDEQRT